MQIKEVQEELTAEEEDAPFYTKEQMFQEIKEYAENGGNLVMKTVPEGFVKPMEEMLTDEEIPFVSMRDEHHTCTIITKDRDAQAFLKVQQKVFPIYQPPKIEPEINKIDDKENNKLLQMEEYDDI